MLRFRESLLDGQLLRTMGHDVYGGAAIGECLATTSSISVGDRESWYAAWRKLADGTFAAAEASLRDGHRQSALGAFLRASNYYRNAYVLHLEAPLPSVALDAYRRHREAFRKATALMPRPPEVIAIPFEGGTMPGYFCAAASEGRRPVVISIGGYDSTAEESYFWNGAAAVSRGYHCVLFDGPGQGAMLLERGLPFRPDWEKAVFAVIDAVAQRPDVDTSRIVLVGESFGGYLAPRAAATDSRVAACVLDPAQLGLYQAILARLPLPASTKAQLPDGPRWAVGLLRALFGRVAKKPLPGWSLRRGMLTHGMASPWDYFVESKRYELGGLVEEIRCPTLVCDARNDAISAYAKAFYERLRCEKGYQEFRADEGAAEHCVSGNRPLFHERIFNWLDACLEKRAASPRSVEGDLLVASRGLPKAPQLAC